MIYFEHPEYMGNCMKNSDPDDPNHPTSGLLMPRRSPLEDFFCFAVFFGYQLDILYKLGCSPTQGDRHQQDDMNHFFAGESPIYLHLQQNQTMTFRHFVEETLLRKLFGNVWWGHRILGVQGMIMHGVSNKEKNRMLPPSTASMVQRIQLSTTSYQFWVTI